MVWERRGDAAGASASDQGGGWEGEGKGTDRSPGGGGGGGGSDGGPKCVSRWYPKDATAAAAAAAAAAVAGGTASDCLPIVYPCTGSLVVYGVAALYHRSDLVDALLAPGTSLCAPSQRAFLGGARGNGDIVRLASSVMAALARRRATAVRAQAPHRKEDKRRALRCGTCHTCLNRQLKKSCLNIKDPAEGDGAGLEAKQGAGDVGDHDDPVSEDFSPAAAGPLVLQMRLKPVMEGMHMPPGKKSKTEATPSHPQHDASTASGPGSSTVTVTTAGGITLTQHVCRYPGCAKVFNGAGQLRKHSLTHGVRPYKCIYPDCGKRFVDSSKLKRHWNSHQGVSDRQYLCPYPECGHAFHNNVQLRHHMMGGHMDEKYYFCPYPFCVKRFTVREKLEDHVRVHETAATLDADAAAAAAATNQRPESAELAPAGQLEAAAALPGGGGGGGGAQADHAGDDFDHDTDTD